MNYVLIMRVRQQASMALLLPGRPYIAKLKKETPKRLVIIRKNDRGEWRGDWFTNQVTKSQVRYAFFSTEADAEAALEALHNRWGTKYAQQAVDDASRHWEDMRQVEYERLCEAATDDVWIK